jgi:hypothetical protein
LLVLALVQASERSLIAKKQNCASKWGPTRRS